VVTALGEALLMPLLERLDRQHLGEPLRARTATAAGRSASGIGSTVGGSTVTSGRR
jgi:hypothetical protein